MLGTDAFFRRLVASSNDGVWVFDPHGRTLYVNERMAQLLGYTVEELGAMARFDAHDEEGRRQFVEHLEELRTRGPNPTDVECDYLDKQGRRTPLIIGESELRDEDGELVGYVHRVTDDHQRRDLVRELSSSREKLDEAQAIARLGSWEMDLGSGTVTISRQMYRLLGLEPGDGHLDPEDFWSRLVPGDRLVAERTMNEAERSGTDFTFDVRLRQDSGTLVWLRGLGRYSYEDGAATRASGTLQDVTEIKEAELQLLDAVVLNALMQVMATAANEARTLSEAVETIRRHLLAHDDWSRAVGFEVVDGRLSPYLGPEPDPARIAEPHETALALRVLRERAVVFDEATLPGKPSVGFLIELDDEPVLVFVISTASPFERHDMVTQMLQQVAGQLETVAQRERATAQLAEARDAAMQASRLKSEFVAMMSHEIRTPMNGVIGLNDLLLRSDLDAHQRRLASGVQTAGRSLLGVINDILDFSKIEAGQLELESVPFVLSEVVEHTLAVQAAAAADKELQLTTEIDPRLPERLVGDPTRLGQVVANLVSNAVKFTHSGGVTVLASLVEEDDDTTTVQIDVVDTGIGIAEEVLPHLFEPFRQAESSINRTFGGTGLGLTICRQLVVAMGGGISVGSEPGRGSTFRVTVPLLRAGAGDERPARSPGTPEPDRPGGRGRVLVVEDNEINQLVALGLLEAFGFETEVVDNGAAAVERALAEDFDVVLMDIQMPGMDGYTAARRIREAEPAGRRTPIVAMTASAMQGERERCLAAGMDDYLSKPVSSQRLEVVLHRFLGEGGDDLPPEEVVAEPAGRVLDTSRLEELDALGEGAAALVTRAIRNFIGNAPATLAEIEAAHRQQDVDLVAALAHRLKGSAWNLGAQEVGNLCERLEHEARAGVLVEVEAQLCAIRTAYDAACSALRDYRALDDDPVPA